MSQKDPSRTPAAKGYQCQDCSYRSPKGFPGGCCPGCGSFNIKRVGQQEDPAPPAARRNFRLALLVMLWVYLVMRIWEAVQRIG